MHACMHTYIQTHTHTYIHTYVRTYIHTYILTDTHTYIHTYVRTYIHTYIHVLNRAWPRVFVSEQHSCQFLHPPFHSSWLISNKQLVVGAGSWSQTKQDRICPTCFSMFLKGSDCSAIWADLSPFQWINHHLNLSILWAWDLQAAFQWLFSAVAMRWPKGWRRLKHTTPTVPGAMVQWWVQWSNDDLNISMIVIMRNLHVWIKTLRNCRVSDRMVKFHSYIS